MPTPDQTAPPLSILVMDNDADTAESFAELLTLYGHTARVALDGASALRQVQTDRPDVVLMDFRTPCVDGCEVARLIRQRCPAREKRPLLIAVSGCAVGDALLRSADETFDLHLVKPVEPAVLIGVLKRFRQVFCPGRPELESDSCPEEEPGDWFSRQSDAVCV